MREKLEDNASLLILVLISLAIVARLVL